MNGKARRIATVMVALVVAFVGGFAYSARNSMVVDMTSSARYFASVFHGRKTYQAVDLSPLLHDFPGFDPPSFDMKVFFAQERAKAEYEKDKDKWVVLAVDTEDKNKRLRMFIAEEETLFFHLVRTPCRGMVVVSRTESTTVLKELRSEERCIYAHPTEVLFKVTSEGLVDAVPYWFYWSR